MFNFVALLNALPGSVAQGILMGIMAIGVYITYKVLDFADLTVDGSLCTGGAVAVMLIMNGVNPYVALLASFVSGMVAGLLTGFFPYSYGYSRHSCRDLEPAWTVFHQHADYGQIKSGGQRG